jgi:hypothetical protein
MTAGIELFERRNRLRIVAPAVVGELAGRKARR